MRFSGGSLRRVGRSPWFAVALVGGLLQAGAVTASQWMLYVVVAGLPSTEQLRDGLGQMARATIIYDAADHPAFSVHEEQRREVPLAAISPHLVAAIVAIEDQRFFDHGGIDLVRIGGAVLANLREGRRAQGGSTLTQQLARQSFLTPEKTYRRKLQEALLALRIERTHSKEQILELYLNRMYFGAGLYGAEAAALGYFGKPARDLTVDEAALIAGLVKSPSTMAPTVSPERALARRNVVLQAMRSTGAIDQAGYERARVVPVALTDALRRDEGFGQYFKEHVRIELAERFGRERVYEGGLRVYTTIDLTMQKAAEAAVATSLRDLDQRRAAALKARRLQDEGNRLQAALVALDPATGHVRAMVGGRRFADSPFNRATQARRQPGSAFKPFVYAAALEAGYTPASLIRELDQPLVMPTGAWTPDDEHADAGELTMRAALRTSSNRAAVRLIEDIGVPAAVSYAGRLGMGSLPAVPSLALGAGEVTLMDLTSAYGAFAAGGLLHRPVLIRRVEDGSGEVLFEAEPAVEQAVTPQTAFLMASMLADVIDSGTAWKARQLGFRLPAGGKTGTTNEYRDAWFVGFTPSLVSGVWVGHDAPQPILPGRAYASDVAVPLWTAFMKAATADAKPAWLTPPPDVVTVQVCRLSGKRPSAGCDTAPVTLADGSTAERSMVMSEYFVRGSEPTDSCHLHVGRSIFARIGDWFRAPPTVHRESPPETASPTAGPATARADPPAPPPSNAGVEPKRKRGFWSRLFGRSGKKGEPETIHSTKSQPEP